VKYTKNDFLAGIIVILILLCFSLIDHELDRGAERIAAIDAKQTLDTESETRVDFYARQVAELAASLKDQNINYLVADAYYSKVKFIDAICSSHLNIVGKWRIDADLQWYVEGEYKGRG